MNPKNLSLFLVTIMLFLIAGVIYVQGMGYRTVKVKCQTFYYDAGNKTLIMNNTIITGVVNITYENGTLIYAKERRDPMLNYVIFFSAILASITLIVFIEEVKKE